MLERRRGPKASGLNEPVFCDALGGFRDPNNVRRDLRRARAPLGSRARREPGRSPSRKPDARRHDGRADVANRLRLAKDSASNSSRPVVCGVEVEEALALATSNPGSSGRSGPASHWQGGGRPLRGGDALAWITSHSFRKTTATILDDAGQSARQIADQLGHARPSLTQDVYMGRRCQEPWGRCRAGRPALNDARDPKPDGFPDKSRVRRDRAKRVTCSYGAPSGTRTPNPLIKSQLLCQLS